jgi:hypothetical protein
MRYNYYICFMIDWIEELKECFIFQGEEDFTTWLLRSNCPKVIKIGPSLGEERFTNMRLYVEGESLKEILDILLREPLADYFWYSYNGKLNYLVSSENQPVPNNVSLIVDSKRIKAFLRDIKIESIIN